MTLFDSATLDALDTGHAAAELAAEHADAAWRWHAEWLIRQMPEGRCFLAEEIAEQCAAGGFTTADKRALGHVIQQAKRAGLISTNGECRPAKSSRGSLKPIWRRL